MRNLIRPGDLASLPSKGEAQTGVGADGKRPYARHATLHEHEKAIK